MLPILSNIEYLYSILVYVTEFASVLPDLLIGMSHTK